MLHPDILGTHIPPAHLGSLWQCCSVGEKLHLLSSVCLSASLFYFPSFQESGPAPEGTLEEVGVAEMAAMRKQVRWW